MSKLITVIRASNIKYTAMEFDGEHAEIASVINPFSQTMGGGLCRMIKGTLEWQLKYDELIYVVHGSMYINQNGVKHEAKAGDTYVINEGALITYGTDNEVLFFFSTYPLNWKELNTVYTAEQVAQNLVTLIHSSDLAYSPIDEATGELSKLAHIVNHTLSATLGGGFAVMKKSAYDWEIKYDESIYVISGSMYITEDGVKHEAKQGDIYFLKEGARITYGSDEETKFFYTLYPVNWRQTKA